MESEGRRIHGLAEQARESGQPLDALKHTDAALLAYQAAGDKLGMAEVLSSRSIALRHLYQATEDKSFLTIAKYNQMSAVDIARESGNRTALAIPLFQLANVQEALGELPDAVTTYRDAIDNIVNNPPDTHNRPAVVADFKVHLTTCEYKTGDKTALQRAEQALGDLESAGEPSKYNKDVWVSGGHMRIADVLRKDNPEKAREHLQKAKDIIDANSELKLRRQQWEKLATSFS